MIGLTITLYITFMGVFIGYIRKDKWFYSYMIYCSIFILLLMIYLSIGEGN